MGLADGVRVVPDVFCAGPSRSAWMAKGFSVSKTSGSLDFELELESELESEIVSEFECSTLTGVDVLVTA